MNRLLLVPALAALLAGCVHSRASVAADVPRLGVEPVSASATIVIPPAERAFAASAAIPFGAWDFNWGENAPEAARAAFGQVFNTVSVADAPDASSDYEIRLAFDHERSKASMAMSSMSSTLRLVVQLFAGRDRLWERAFEKEDHRGGGYPDLAVLGRELSEVMRQAAVAVHHTVSLRSTSGPAASAPVAQSPAAAPVAVAATLSDVDELPAARASRKGHAVIIGIEDYREKLPKADFAVADAKLVAEYARRVLGYPEENVALLLGDRATRGDMQKYFERWLANRVEKGDEVFVYFSGHGAPDPKSGDAFLVPYDGDPSYIDQTGYPIKQLYQNLAKLPAKRVIVAMDSCFSGAGGRSVIARGARPLITVKNTVVPGNLTVLAASAGDQVSNSYLEKGHGLFTYFLLKGLKDHGTDAQAVFDYLKPEVTRVARRQYNMDQVPQLQEGR